MIEYYENVLVEKFPHHKYAKKVYWRKLNRKMEKKAKELLKESVSPQLPMGFYAKTIILRL